jgi:hypothetical protein
MDAMTSLHANEIARFFHRNCGDYEREFDSCRLFDPATIENLDAAGVIIENRYNQIVTLATIAYPVKSPEWGLVGIALPPIDREGKLVFVHAVACVPWLRPYGVEMLRELLRERYPQAEHFFGWRGLRRTKLMPIVKRGALCLG